MDIDKTGAQVTSISESRNGKILIKLKAKNTERAALEEELRNKQRQRANVRGPSEN